MTYVMKPPPPSLTDVDGLSKWVQDELFALSQDLAETTALELRPIYVAPTRPREGMIVSADGTSWNPGSGAGAYEYKGGAWVKL